MLFYLLKKDKLFWLFAADPADGIGKANAAGNDLIWKVTVLSKYWKHNLCQIRVALYRQNDLLPIGGVET